MKNAKKNAWEEEIHQKADYWIAGELASASKMMASSAMVVGAIKKKALVDAERSEEVYKDMGPIGKEFIKNGMGLDSLQRRDDFFKELKELCDGAKREAVVFTNMDADAFKETPARGSLAKKIRSVRGSKAACPKSIKPPAP